MAKGFDNPSGTAADDKTLPMNHTHVASIVDAIKEMDLGSDAKPNVAYDDTTTLSYATLAERIQITDVNRVDLQYWRDGSKEAQLVEAYHQALVQDNVTTCREVVWRLSRGAINRREPVHGATALILACHIGTTSLVAELLVSGKAKINKPDFSGRTALMAATARGRWDIVTLLLRYRANLEARDHAGLTAVDRLPDGLDLPFVFRGESHANEGDG
jgi:hypothetical protein